MYDHVGNRTVMQVTDSSGTRNHVYSYDNYDKAGNTTYDGGSNMCAYDAETQQDRQQLAQVIAQDTGKSQAEANQRIDNMNAKLQQAKQTGEQAANITGATFIGLSISMIIGVIVAMLGSLAASAPVPPYEYKRTTGARTEAGTYVSR